MSAGGTAGSSPWTLRKCVASGTLARDFGEAVGAARVIGRGKGDVGTEGLGGVGDAFVIGRDHNGVHAAGFAATLPDVLDERLASDGTQRLAGEARGGPAGGDDGEKHGGKPRGWKIENGRKI